MMIPKTKTRIIFDFENDHEGSYERLNQIICSSHWTSRIDIYGILNKEHSLFFAFIAKGIIVIDECEYEIEEHIDNELSHHIDSLLGKRISHPVLRDMATLFDNEPYERSRYFSNTLYLPNLKAFARADGMKPEDAADMLSRDECDKIILFPYYENEGKNVYYELTLAVDKGRFAEYMNQTAEQRANELYEASLQAYKRSTAGYKATLRLEKKSDWKMVEQITYRAFHDAPPTGADDDGREALLARNLRSRDTFVPGLDYVAELDGKVIGNIMYTRSHVVGDNGKWEVLTFGPVSILPKYQKQGVGSALINKTLDVARELGERAVLIFGHESYYPRFGFKPAMEFGITTEDGKNFPAFMALPLYDGALDSVHGRLICDEAYTSLDEGESDKLNAKLAEPMDVDEYIDAQPMHLQRDLRRIRHTMRKALPHAEETITRAMPTYRQENATVRFSAQKNYFTLYPGAEAVAYFAPRLRRFKTNKDAVKISYTDLTEEHLALITEIASWCDNAHML